SSRGAPISTAVAAPAERVRWLGAQQGRADLGGGAPVRTSATRARRRGASPICRSPIAPFKPPRRVGPVLRPPATSFCARRTAGPTSLFVTQAVSWSLRNNQGRLIHPALRNGSHSLNGCGDPIRICIVVDHRGTIGTRMSRMLASSGVRQPLRKLHKRQAV